MRKEYKKGDRVIDVHTGRPHIVTRSEFQHYAGGDTSDYTVSFELTGWNKSQNLVDCPTYISRSHIRFLNFIDQKQKSLDIAAGRW